MIKSAPDFIKSYSLIPEAEIENQKEMFMFNISGNE